MNERPLGELLGRSLDPRAVDEVWDRVEAKRNAFGTRRAWRVPALVASFACVGLLGWRSMHSAHISNTATVASVASSGAMVVQTASTELRLASGLPLTTAAVASRELEDEVALDDGSRLLLTPGSRLVPVVNLGTEVAWSLAAGTVTFDVMPHGPRTWSIDAGVAKISVLGTRFRVLRDGDHVRVDVERGLVLVESPLLAAGQQRLGPGDHVDLAPPAPAPHEAASLAAPPAPPTPAASATQSWKQAAVDDGYHAAYLQLGPSGIARETQQTNSPQELLALADVARLSGHPRDAIAPLERLLATHADDTRASAAAFTLGKIQLDAMNAPAAAASAFERAIALRLPQALREDAFARRVQAYAAAGNTERARASRAAYDAEYPEGRHRSGVASWAP